MRAINFPRRRGKRSHDTTRLLSGSSAVTGSPPCYSLPRDAGPHAFTFPTIRGQTNPFPPLEKTKPLRPTPSVAFYKTNPLPPRSNETIRKNEPISTAAERSHHGGLECRARSACSKKTNPLRPAPPLAHYKTNPCRRDRTKPARKNKPISAAAERTHRGPF